MIENRDITQKRRVIRVNSSQPSAVSPCYRVTIRYLTFFSKKAFTFEGDGKAAVESRHAGGHYMLAFFVNLLNNEDGATAIEYGLIAALIAVAAVTVMGTVGTNLSSTFNTVATKL